VLLLCFGSVSEGIGLGVRESAAHARRTLTAT
jgi:hypothetical protein